jgi:hypothetical protein
MVENLKRRDNVETREAYLEKTHSGVERNTGSRVADGCR